jgi:zinc/manganese transport system permease protein
MLAYDFVIRAFLASGAVALVAAAVGYFMVLRGQTFAGHALSHVGFAGATGAGLIGATPLAGLVAFTVAAGVAIGLIGDRISGRDVAIGVVLTVALGFGLLFLTLTTTQATQATALLFGNILAVTPETLLALLVLGAGTLVALAVISRPLLFATLQPELAEAKGVPLTALGVAFLALVALAVAQSALVVGVLLVFTLMVGPPAAAQLLTARLLPGIALAVGLAIAEAWLGIVAAWYSDWPVTFWIALFSGIAYAGAALYRRAG